MEMESQWRLLPIQFHETHAPAHRWPGNHDSLAHTAEVISADRDRTVGFGAGVVGVMVGAALGDPLGAIAGAALGLGGASVQQATGLSENAYTVRYEDGGTLPLSQRPVRRRRPGAGRASASSLPVALALIHPIEPVSPSRGIPMSEFNDRFAVVTGASSGIGLKLTETLLGRARLSWRWQRRERPPESLHAHSGKRLHWLAGDVTRERDLDALASRAASIGPSITWYPTPASPSSPTAWTAWRSSSSGGSAAPGR